MLPKSMIRVRLADEFPQLSRQQLTAVTDKVHAWAYSEQDLSRYRLEGAIKAHLRHTATTYEQDLRAHASQCYGSARKHFQEIAHNTLKLKFGL